MGGFTFSPCRPGASPAHRTNTITSTFPADDLSCSWAASPFLQLSRWSEVSWEAGDQSLVLPFAILPCHLYTKLSREKSSSRLVLCSETVENCRGHRNAGLMWSVHVLLLKIILGPSPSTHPTCVPEWSSVSRH